MKNITTKTELDEILSTSAYTILKFGATWCGPCQQVAPIFEAVSQKHSDVTFVSVDVDDAQELAGQLGIQQVPTMLFFKQSALINNICGPVSETLLDEAINSYFV